MLWVWGLFGLAVAGTPQCATTLRSCPYTVGDGLFWMKFFKVRYSDHPYRTVTARERRVVCSAEGWRQVQRCHDKCPLRLEITQPADLRMTICLVPNEFLPYAPDAHIDLHHPLNGVEYDIMNMSDSLSSCAAGSGGVSGKIALLAPRCYGSSAVRTARARGAVASIKVATQKFNKVMSTWPSSGSSSGLEDFPSAVMPRPHGLLLWEVLEQGVPVRGRVVFSCDGLPAVGSMDVADLGGCPSPELSGMCNDMPLPQDRLCLRCPLELRVAGIVVCLWGNALLPHKRETLLQNTVQLPVATAASEVVVASDLPDSGCSASDYAQLAGKIVVVQGTWSCLPFTQVRMAQAQGVRAVVLKSRFRFPIYRPVEGPSHPISIPVHFITEQNYSALESAALQTVAGVGRMLGAGQLGVGPAFAPLPPPLVPEKGPPPTTTGLSDPDWKLVIIYLLLIFLELVMLAFHMYHQRKSGVRLQAGASPSVPLGMASTGLSLSLLVLTAAVAFSLAHVAGKESTDTALEDGRAATQAAHGNAADNVEDLAARMRSIMLSHAITGARSMFDAFESHISAHRIVARDFDGTWQTFIGMYAKFQQLLGSHVTTLRVHLLTVNGFFASSDIVTDYRTEAQRDDGVVGDVLANNTGFPYGLMQSWDPHPAPLWASIFYPSSVFNVSNVLGSTWRSPLSLFNASSHPSERVWYVPRRAVDVQPIASGATISMVIPFFNKDGQYLGTLEAVDLLSSVGRIVQRAVEGVTMASLYVMLVDYTDGAILGDAVGDNIAEEAVFPYFDPVWLFQGTKVVQSIHTLGTAHAVHINAVGNYLTAQHHGWLEHSGEFDQRAEWSQTTLPYLTKLRARDGSVQDESMSDMKAESRGGTCGTCTVMDSDLGHEVLVFDGGNVLHIYNNLTVGAPAVAKTRTSAVGQAWASNEPEYAESIVMSDGTECVARRPPGGGALGCFMRPAFTHVKDYTISMRVWPDYVAVNRQVRGAHLFSQTFDGETNVRLFADGELSINVLGRGCTVRGVPGGLPARQWSTVTAVTKAPSSWQDDTDDHCMVFINGLLYGSSYYTRDYVISRDQMTPYYVGRHFHGRLDNIMLFGETLTAAEVLSLHTSGALVRDVPSRKWFVATKGLDGLGQVSWSVVVMMPRESIMWKVDENNRATLAHLSSQEAVTMRELDRKSVEAVLVIVVIALFCVGVFLVFNTLLTRPFSRYAVLMTEAAVMKVDVLPEEESFIRELRAMNNAMTMMLSNLKYYKTFMPESLFEYKPQAHEYADEAPGLESGSVAVVFTDIEKSTALWEACPDGMSVALRVHNAVMRQQIAAHDGYEVKTIGDAFM